MSVDGLIVIDKPVGPTSHDVVDGIRRLYGQRRVGHTGTLDPAASGVLVVCLGRATRLVRFLQEGEKIYEGRFMLGVTTDSLDAQGAETGRTVCSAGRTEVQRAMSTLVGTIAQRPPMMSAVKVEGRKLYRLARQGEDVEREPRAVRVERFALTGFDDGDFPIVGFEVECGKGTYVRSLVGEVGDRLGCGAHVIALRRTRNGPYSLESAHTLGALEGDGQARERAVVPIDEIDLGLPTLHLSDTALRKVRHGGTLSSGEHPELSDVGCDGYFDVREEGRLMAVYRLQCTAGGVTAAPECVLAPGAPQET